MPRPLKQGLDYFPLDAECDDKVKMVDAKYGVAGFGILIKLWQIIYGNGYFIKWTEREVLLYKNRLNADINFINDVINECIKWELFNPVTYNLHGVLTSRGIQKRYLEAIRRRHEITVYLDFWEIDLPEATERLAVTIVPKTINAINNHVNGDNNPINSGSSTQSRVNRKESKKRVKESIYTDNPVYQQIVKMWNEITSVQPKVKGMNATRAKAIDELYTGENMNEFEDMFRRVAASTFLCGNNDSSWVCNFDWVLKPEKWQKISEGTYDNRTANTNRFSSHKMSEAERIMSL